MPCAGPGNRDSMIDLIVEYMYPLEDIAPVWQWKKFEKAIDKAMCEYYATFNIDYNAKREVLMGVLCLYAIDPTLPKEWFREKMKEFDFYVLCYDF